MQTKKLAITSGATLASALIATLIIGTGAEAYIGPGSGLAAIGSLIALVGAAILAVFGFVWFPIKRLLKRSSAKQDDKLTTD